MIDDKVYKLRHPRQLWLALECDPLGNQVFLKERLAVRGFVHHVPMFACSSIRYYNFGSGLFHFSSHRKLSSTEGRDRRLSVSNPEPTLP